MGRQKNSIEIQSHNIDFNKGNNFIFYMYVILINLPMLFRGGYFEKELLPILIGINIIFFVWLFTQRENEEFRVFSNPIEILFFGIVIMYLLSILYGVDKRGSIIEVIKYFSYFATIVLGINLAKDKRYQKGILDTIILASVIISIIGISAAIGTFNYTDAILGGRISSTFQYPNTLAAFLGAIYFLSLSMLINADNRVKKAIYGIVLGVIIFTFILTYSRAMWLMFPVSVVLYFIFIPNSRKLETLVYMTGSVIISIPASFLFTRGIGEPSNKLWVVFLAVVLGTGLLTATLSSLENKFRAVSIKKLLMVLTFLFVIVVALGIYVLNSTTEITLKNGSNENKWTSLNRNITALQPSTDYKLRLAYIGGNLSDATYLGRVLVYDISDTDGITELALGEIVEVGENIYEIPFTTNQNSAGVRVSFDNYYAGTFITVNESTIIEANNSELVVNIPLKYKYIPENIVSRFNSITASETSFTMRIAFNKDGLGIAKDYLLLGSGGGGWKTLYLSYQSEPYISNQAHNFFLQLLIEIGAIGLILIIGILLLLTIFTYKAINKSDDDSFKSLLVGLYVTMFTMLFHAFVDFDMSLSGYAIILWVIVGVLASNIDFSSSKLDKVISKGSKVNKKISIYGLSIITIIIIFIIGSFTMGSVYVQKAVKANESNDAGKAMINFEKAIQYDGYEPSYRIDLSNLYMNLYSASNETGYVRKAIEQVEKYIKLSPYNTQVISSAGSFYFSIGEFEKGLEYIEKLVELKPMMISSYMQKLDVHLALYDYYYYEGNDRKAKRALEDGLTVKEQIAEINAKSEKSMDENIDFAYKIGRAQFLLENFDQLDDISERNLIFDFAYYFDVDINSDENPDMLRVSKPEVSNIQYEQHTDEENFVRITNDSEIPGTVEIIDLKLHPNTKYLIEFHARGNIKTEAIRTYVMSNESVQPNQGGLDSIQLTEDWNIYFFEFTTDSDVTPGKQFIMLQHLGNDEGYIDIKDLIIYESSN